MVGCQQRRKSCWTGRQYQRLIKRRASPFQNAQQQRITVTLRRCQHPQHGRRGLILCLDWTHHKQKLAMRVGRYLQTPQLLNPNLRQPSQHGGYLRTAQSLLS
jgi:hypothetical protein